MEARSVNWTINWVLKLEALLEVGSQRYSWLSTSRPYKLLKGNLRPNKLLKENLILFAELNILVWFLYWAVRQCKMYMLQLTGRWEKSVDWCGQDQTWKKWNCKRKSYLICKTNISIKLFGSTFGFWKIINWHYRKSTIFQLL